MYGREWFPVELRDKPWGLLFGRFSTPSAKEAMKKGEEIDELYEGIQTKDKEQIEREAMRLYNKFKEMDPSDANTALDELEILDPFVARKIRDMGSAETQIRKTVEEAKWERFDITGGYRAKALYEYFKDYSEIERNKILNNWLDRGTVLTPTVVEQLKKYYGWGAEPQEEREPEPKYLKEFKPNLDDFTPIMGL